MPRARSRIPPTLPPRAGLPIRISATTAPPTPIRSLRLATSLLSTLTKPRATRPAVPHPIRPPNTTKHRRRPPGTLASHLPHPALRLVADASNDVSWRPAPIATRPGARAHPQWIGSDVEPKMHDVAILDDVFAPFEAHLAGFLRPLLTL